MNCGHPEMVAMLDAGCCFASMMQQFAWKDEEDISLQDAEMEQMVMDFTQCGGSMAPCGTGATMEVEVVRSSISFDGLPENYFKKASNRLEVRKTIAADVGGGVKSSQVLLLGTSKTASSRRQLGTTTNLEYQVTVAPENAAQKSAVETKISSGLDTNSFKSIDSDMASVTVVPSTQKQTLGSADFAKCANGAKDAQETDVDCGGGMCAACVAGQGCAANSDCTSMSCLTGGTCDTPAPTNAPTNAPTGTHSHTVGADTHSNANEDDGLGAGAIAAIAVLVVAILAIAIFWTQCKRHKSPSDADVKKVPEAGTVPQTKVVVATEPGSTV